MTITPDDVSSVDLEVLLSTLPPTHPLVTAARLAIEVGAMRAGTPINLDHDYAEGGRYHRQHQFPEYSELQKRRWPPNGDRDEWVRNGESRPHVDVDDALQAAFDAVQKQQDKDPA